FPVGHALHDVGEQIHAVHRFDENVHGIRTGRVLLPPNVQAAPFSVQGEQIRAIPSVDRHAPTPRNVSDDLIARHRVAAAGKSDENVVDTLDSDAVMNSLPDGTTGAVAPLPLPQPT